MPALPEHFLMSLMIHDLDTTWHSVKSNGFGVKCTCCTMFWLRALFSICEVGMPLWKWMVILKKWLAKWPKWLGIQKAVVIVPSIAIIVNSGDEETLLLPSPCFHGLSAIPPRGAACLVLFGLYLFVYLFISNIAIQDTYPSYQHLGGGNL